MVMYLRKRLVQGKSPNLLSEKTRLRYFRKEIEQNKAYKLFLERNSLQNILREYLLWILLGQTYRKRKRDQSGLRILRRNKRSRLILFITNSLPDVDKILKTSSS